MRQLDLGGVRRILCIGAHPDDIEIGCGGTVLRLLGEQPTVEVYWMVLSGADGRADEARNGAAEFLRRSQRTKVAVSQFRDALFPYEGELIKDRLRQARAEFSPDLIFSHRRDDMHQDHRLIGELTWNVFRDHLILEYEIPKYEGDLGTPNVYVTLSDDICRRKVEAVVRTFRTQHSKQWFSADTFWALLRLRGIECNSPSGFAEGLYGRKMVLGPA